MKTNQFLRVNWEKGLLDSKLVFKTAVLANTCKHFLLSCHNRMEAEDSDYEVGKHILNILAYLWFHGNPCFLTMEMDSCTHWMKGANKQYLLCIFSTKTQKRWVEQLELLCTSHLSLGSSLSNWLQYKLQRQVAFSHWLSSTLHVPREHVRGVFKVGSYTSRLKFQKQMGPERSEWPNTHTRTRGGGFEKWLDYWNQLRRAQDCNFQDGSYDGRSENFKANGMKWLERPN